MICSWFYPVDSNFCPTRTKPGPQEPCGLQFLFPSPGPLTGVKTRGKAILKLKSVRYQYPKSKPGLWALEDIDLEVSQVGPGWLGVFRMLDWIFFFRVENLVASKEDESFCFPKIARDLCAVSSWKVEFPTFSLGRGEF